MYNYYVEHVLCDFESTYIKVNRHLSNLALYSDETIVDNIVRKNRYSPASGVDVISISSVKNAIWWAFYMYDVKSLQMTLPVNHIS